MITPMNQVSSNYSNYSKIKDQLFIAVKKGDIVTTLNILQEANIKDKVVEDAYCNAAIHGQWQIIEVMINANIDPNPRLSPFGNDDDLYPLTAMGYAIKYRHQKVIEILLKKDIPIDQVSDHHYALDIYFSNSDNDTTLFSFLLDNKATLHSLKEETIFKMASSISFEELEKLIQAGFDINCIVHHGLGHEKITFLDLFVMRAEKNNLFSSDVESINMVNLLLEKGAKAFEKLHALTNVDLINVLLNFSKNYIKKEEWIFYQTLTPMDLASKEIISAFKEHCKEISIEHLKHQNKILEAEKLFSKHGLTKSGELSFVKMYEKGNYKACMALINFGVNLNQQEKIASNWTILHHLFYNLKHFDHNDFFLPRGNGELFLIKMAIKHGAIPLLDNLQRTPLMCMHSLASETIDTEVLDIFIEFEAKHFKLDFQEYRKSFFILMKYGYQRVYTLHKIPIPEIFNAFWKSFEDKCPFNPKNMYIPEYSLTDITDIIFGKSNSIKNRFHS